MVAHSRICIREKADLANVTLYSGVFSQLSEFNVGLYVETCHFS